MSLKSLFRQTITIYAKSGYDSQGRESVGAGTTAKARFQATSKTRLLPNGSIKNIDGIAYVGSDVTVNIDDKVTYDSENYKVLGKYKVPDGQGNTNHIKLELIKWQE